MKTDDLITIQGMNLIATHLLLFIKHSLPSIQFINFLNKISSYKFIPLTVKYNKMLRLDISHF